MFSKKRDLTSLIINKILIKTTVRSMVPIRIATIKQGENGVESEAKVQRYNHMSEGSENFSSLMSEEQSAPAEPSQEMKSEK